MPSRSRRAAYWIAAFLWSALQSFRRWRLLRNPAAYRRWVDDISRNAGHNSTIWRRRNLRRLHAAGGSGLPLDSIAFCARDYGEFLRLYRERETLIKGIIAEILAEEKAAGPGA